MLKVNSNFKHTKCLAQAKGMPFNYQNLFVDADSVHDMSIEELWQDVFNNPSQWWDNRLNKVCLFVSHWYP